jgi:hypothetical protein
MRADQVNLDQNNALFSAFPKYEMSYGGPSLATKKFGIKC